MVKISAVRNVSELGFATNSIVTSREDHRSESLLTILEFWATLSASKSQDHIGTLHYKYNSPKCTR